MNPFTNYMLDQKRKIGAVLSGVKQFTDNKTNYWEFLNSLELGMRPGKLEL